MTPGELYREGKLREAITKLSEELRKTPLDSQRRTFLFELLLFTGEYDRAEKQLDVLADSGSDTAAGALLYRSALHAERTRQQMFEQLATPPLTESNGMQFSGRCDGINFASLGDTDPRIGQNMEAFVAGSYVWIPMKFLRKIEIQAPRRLRDLCWASARIETTKYFPLQDMGEVFLPVLSPLSFRHPDEAVQLGRATVWNNSADQPATPCGAKMLLVDETEIPLLQIRSIEWNLIPKEASDVAA